MKKSLKQLTSITLAFALAGTAVLTPVDADAAKKATLSTKKLNIKVGKKATIKIRNKKKKAKYAFSSSKKAVATVSKSGVVKGVKKGSATITVKETKNKKKKIVGKVKVTVVANENTQQTEAPATAVPDTNTTTAPIVTNAPVQKTDPSPTPTAKPKATSLQAYPADDDWSHPDVSKLQKIEKWNAAIKGKVQDFSYESTAVAKDKTVKRRAKIVFPAGYDATAGKKYPVVYMLHGIGMDQNSMCDDSNKCQYAMWNAIWDGACDDFIMVCPNVCANEAGNAGAGGMYSLEYFQAFDNFINDLDQCLMPYVEKTYPVKTGRENTAIAGFSMGGRETINIGIKLASKFGYVGAFCPAVGVLPYEREEGLFTKETLKMPAEYKDKTIFMIVGGSSDNVVNDSPKQYAETMQANGEKIFWYLNKNTGHGADTHLVGFYNLMKRMFRSPVVEGTAK